MYNNSEIKSTTISVNNQSIQSIIIPGQYQLIQNSFFIGNTKILIRERKNPEKKSKYFISALSGKNHIYISSLYQHDDVYEFDYQGRFYKMQIVKDCVIIQ